MIRRCTPLEVFPHKNPDALYIQKQLDAVTQPHKNLDVHYLFEDPYNFIYIDDVTGVSCRIHVNIDALHVRIVWLLPLDTSLDSAKAVFKAAALDAAETYPVALNFEFEGYIPTIALARTWRRFAFTDAEISQSRPDADYRIALPTFRDGIEVITSWVF